MRGIFILNIALTGISVVPAGTAAETPRFPASTHNLLVEAEVSGNLESFGKGLRGRPDHMIYDTRKGRFLGNSQYHEYGVGFQQDLGIIPEEKPAFWMARWKSPIQANLISLSGVYPNQPQPDTCWKIELHARGKWTTHARGKGGWYDRGRYIWGGAGRKPEEFDALRISVFSKDGKTPIRSIHFRGEKEISWIVASVPPIDARIRISPRRVRAGAEVRLAGEGLAGDITSWAWDFGDGSVGQGQEVEHAYRKPGEYEIRLVFSDGQHRASVRGEITVVPPVEARITPLTAPVLAGKAVTFSGEGSVGAITGWTWDFGDGKTDSGPSTNHTFTDPGIYRVKLTVSGGTYTDDGLALVRVHTEKTLNIPQVFLDTDQKNEVDDQHYLAYAVFSELDVLGVNSIHHGGGQEPINYGEIINILNLSRESGLPESRRPLVFRGANERLAVPESLRWEETEPLITGASEAILAAARGASPSNPLWVVPVGPGTNTASAILQAREEGLHLKNRMRVMWLGGSSEGITREFNGNNDPWSMVVVGRSDLETWIMPAPVGGRIKMDKREESGLYPGNPLGRYLEKITPAHNKSLYDPSCLAAIISMRLGLGWVREVEPVAIGGPEKDYRWTGVSREKMDARVIRQIDQEAMKREIFDTLNGKPRPLIGVP